MLKNIIFLLLIFAFIMCMTSQPKEEIIEDANEVLDDIEHEISGLIYELKDFEKSKIEDIIDIADRVYTGLEELSKLLK